MKTLNNLNIGARLGLAFAAVIALAAVVVFIGISRLSELKDSIKLIGDDRVPKVVLLVDIGDDVNLIARELRNALIWDDPAKVATALDTAQQAREKIGKTLDALVPTINSDEGKKRLSVMTETRAAFMPLQIQFIDLVRAGKKDEAKTLLADKMRPAQLAYMEALHKMKSFQLELINNAAVDGQAHYAQARDLMFGLLAGMVGLGTLVGWVITRGITGPIGQAVAVAEKVAAGDLGAHIDVRSTDETGRLLTALKDMNTSLAGIVSSVPSSTMPASRPNMRFLACS